MRKRVLVLFVALLMACATELPQLEPTSPSPASGGPGRLILARWASGIWEFDLATSVLRPLFELDPDGQAWVTAAAVSPDGQTIVLAYAPAPPAGEIQWGYTDLYVMPADGSAAPQPFLTRRETNESFFNPGWSADGRSIYYAHLKKAPSVDPAEPQLTYQYLVERAPYPPAPGGERGAGPSAVIIENAYWPRLSRDGTRLAYVALSADSTENRLWVANADGSGAQPVAGLAAFTTVDAPVFTPDGTALLFSAPSPPPASARPAWEAWLGVPAAWAHNIPSDWWRVTLADERVEQLTQMAETGLYGDFSPDGRRLAFITAGAVMMMDADGQNLARLTDSSGLGTVAWAGPAP